jgi:hypothetical protein
VPLTTPCLAEDDFVLSLQDERRTPVWEVRLSDGTTAYLDDGRPGADPPQGWLRLRAHVLSRGLRATSARLRFRSHSTQPLALAGADGLYFRKRAVAILGQEDNLYYYLLGSLKDGLVNVQCWQVPELILFHEFVRPASDDDPSLIRWN